MKAEVVLTPTESKKLIADAIFRLPQVRRALAGGLLAIHPSSSTIFLYEAITGSLPDGLWVCGIVSGKGLCGSEEAVRMIRGRGKGPHDPREVSMETWVFEKGNLLPPMPLGEILNRLGPEDIYIKGVNALDPYGHTGVLFSNPAGGGGTIGKVMAARRQSPFQVLLPVGLEKLIPVSIEEASHAVGFRKTDRAMGIPAALLPVEGSKIDERDALLTCFGIRATPISAGALDAGGSIVLVLDGEEDAVARAFNYLESIKGISLPALHLPECADTCYPTLSL